MLVGGTGVGVAVGGATVLVGVGVAVLVGELVGDTVGVDVGVCVGVGGAVVLVGVWVGVGGTAVPVAVGDGGTGVLLGVAVMGGGGVGVLGGVGVCEAVGCGVLVADGSGVRVASGVAVGVLVVAEGGPELTGMPGKKICSPAAIVMSLSSRQLACKISAILTPRSSEMRKRLSPGLTWYCTQLPGGPQAKASAVGAGVRVGRGAAGTKSVEPGISASLLRQLASINSTAPRLKRMARRSSVSVRATVRGIQPAGG